MVQHVGVWTTIGLFAVLVGIQGIAGLKTESTFRNVVLPSSPCYRRIARVVPFHKAKPDGELESGSSALASEEGNEGETLFESTSANSAGLPPPVSSRLEQPSQLSFQERVDEFLDRPFFNPDAYDKSDENDPSFLARFARLVKSDYELAETLYVGMIFVVLVIVSQELLRMQLYGDAYIPFASRGGVGSGRLF